MIMKDKAVDGSFWERKISSLLEKIIGRGFLQKHGNLSKIKARSINARILIPCKGQDLSSPPLELPGLYIRESDAWRIFDFACDRLSEVSLLMRVNQEGEKIVFSHPIFPEQTCGTFRTDINNRWLAEYSRGLPSFEERAAFNSSCNFWIHSHPRGNLVKWSLYDGTKIDEMMRGKKILISMIVVAEKGVLRYRCRIDFGSPFRLTFDNIPIRVIPEKNIDREEIKKSMDMEYETKVSIVEHSIFPAEDNELIFGEVDDDWEYGQWQR